MEERIRQLRAEVQAHVVRFFAAILVGASSFMVFALPGDSQYFFAAKIGALIVFGLAMVYGIIVWLMAFSKRQQLRQALRRPN